jgi:hypothetical protein
MSHAAKPPAIVIAFARRHVGIALPAQDGFAFVATDPDFELLDGSSFRRLEQLEAAAQSMARAVAGQDRREVTSVPAICPGQLGWRTQSSTPSNQCL